MTVIGIGDLQMADGAKFSGIVIEADREELKEIAGNILYREVIVEPVSTGKDGRLTFNDMFGKVFGGMAERLCAVDRRVREAKPTRQYSRDEVLAMLDEIDPGKTNGEVNDGK